MNKYLQCIKSHSSRHVLVISGGSSGIGQAICTRFADKGFIVYEISRTGKDVTLASGNKINHVTGDVLDDASLQYALKVIMQHETNIELVIANAGYGISGSIENTVESDYKRQLDLNYFGNVRLIQACLPYMRNQGYGRIFCMSSVAGILPIPFQSFYSASKAAIISLARSLALEVKPFGIEVCAICPGDVNTSFTAMRQKNQELNSVYDTRFRHSINKMEHDEAKGMTPAQIATCVYRQAIRRQTKQIVVPGLAYKVLVSVAKIMPIRLIDYILGKMYA